MTSALIRETKVSEYVDVDSMTKEKNYIYYSSDGQIVYVNAKGQLRVVDNNKITDIASDVNAGSLSKVYNKSKALHMFQAAGSTIWITLRAKLLQFWNQMQLQIQREHIFTRTESMRMMLIIFFILIH